MKILHTPSDVGGQAWGLSRAERILGYYSDNVIFQAGKFLYNSDVNLHLENKTLFLQLILQVIFFLKCITKYNVFHFYFGQSLLPRNIDLPILKFFRKKIFFTFQGCDIRLHKTKLAWDNHHCIIVHTHSCNIISDHEKLKKIKFISKYSNKTFVLNPDLKLASTTSEMLPYSHIDLNIWKPIKNNKISMPKKKILTVVHAPTDREIKGTQYIIDTVKKLSENGYRIKLQLLENLTHIEMISACLKADLAIDQLLIGWYGGYAVEMMALEKPVICYLDKRLSSFVPYYNKIPIINASPKTLYSVLEDFLKNAESIHQIGIKSRKFVEKIHNPITIAQKLTNIYKDAYSKS